MEHSKNYEKVKCFYDIGMWNVDRVRNAVVKGWINEAEFLDITGFEANLPTGDKEAE